MLTIRERQNSVDIEEACLENSWECDSTECYPDAEYDLDDLEHASSAGYDRHAHDCADVGSLPVTHRADEDQPVPTAFHFVAKKFPLGLPRQAPTELLIDFSYVVPPPLTLIEHDEHALVPLGAERQQIASIDDIFESPPLRVQWFNAVLVPARPGGSSRVSEGMSIDWSDRFFGSAPEMVQAAYPALEPSGSGEVNFEGGSGNADGNEDHHRDNENGEDDNNESGNDNADGNRDSNGGAEKSGSNDSGGDDDSDWETDSDDESDASSDDGTENPRENKDSDQDDEKEDQNKNEDSEWETASNAGSDAADHDSAIEPINASVAEGETFNVFRGLFIFPELVLNVAKFLGFENLLSLYAIDKDFHYLANTRFTTVMKGIVSVLAPRSGEIFAFRYFADLCMKDPARRPHPRNANETRRVPTFRWLRMILFRERVVNEIIGQLLRDEFRLPKDTDLTLRKLWVIMDLPTTVQRTSYVQNPKFFTNQDCWLAMTFFIKLDMRFTDPVDGTGESTLREMLLAQRSLTTLWLTLRNVILNSSVEALKMYLRWRHRPADQHNQLTVFGVRPAEMGSLRREGWGQGTGVLLRPDQVVMAESVRRNLGIETKITDLLCWGYNDPDTLEPLDMPTLEPLPEVEDRFWDDGSDVASSDSSDDSVSGEEDDDAAGTDEE